MQSYSQRVRDSILPLSVGDTLPKAFEEWYFTGSTEDHEEPRETCELCGQDGLRYHFEIGNTFTGYVLQVGSHCILQFDVAVYEGSRRLTPKEAKKWLDKLTQQMRLNSCIKALETLACAEQSSILENALAYYRKNKNSRRNRHSSCSGDFGATASIILRPFSTLRCARNSMRRTYGKWLPTRRISSGAR